MTSTIQTILGLTLERDDARQRVKDLEAELGNVRDLVQILRAHICNTSQTHEMHEMQLDTMKAQNDRLLKAMADAVVRDFLKATA